MAFEGYLMKTGNTIFPHQYILLESWKTTPNQREEIRAYRDENTRNLTRVTAAGRKSVIKFTTRPNLHLSEKQAIQKFFTDNEVDADQRKIQITFWNDESNSYTTGYFYRPNMEFPIKVIKGNDIVYGSLEFSLIEY